MRIPTFRLAVIGLFLPISLLAGILVIAVIFATGVHENIGAPLAAASVVLCLAAGGGLWARALLPALRPAGGHARRIILTGALSYTVVMIIAMQGLGTLEREFVEAGHTTLPLHVLYTLLFVPAAFLTNGLFALAVTLAAGRDARIALVPALSSALAYLVLNVLQDLLGRRVGGPNAAATATMITVTFVCAIGSALVFTVVFGRLLHRERSLPEMGSVSASPAATAPTA